MESNILNRNKKNNAEEKPHDFVMMFRRLTNRRKTRMPAMQAAGL